MWCYRTDMTDDFAKSIRRAATQSQYRRNRCLHGGPLAGVKVAVSQDEVSNEMLGC